MPSSKDSSNTMQELPLLPLQSTFYPGFPIRLNIFEGHYQKILHECFCEKKDFGVILIKDMDETSNSPVQPHNVGIATKIIALETTDQNDIIVNAIGRSRFWIRELSYEKNYLRGKVEIEVTEISAKEDEEDAQYLLTLLYEYIHLIGYEIQEYLGQAKIPKEARAIAYLSTYFLQIPQETKQIFLSIRKTKDMISALIEFYQEQIPLLHIIHEKSNIRGGYLN